jgi:hypothetical protein
VFFVHGVHSHFAALPHCFRALLLRCLQQMLQNKLWSTAAMCFRQAGDWLREAAATAKSHLDAVQRHSSSSTSDDSASVAPAVQEKLKTREGRRQLLEQAATLLLEAAAAVGRTITTTNSSSSSSSKPSSSAGAASAAAVAVSSAEWREWVGIAATVLGGPLDRCAEAVALHCMVSGTAAHGSIMMLTLKSTSSYYAYKMVQVSWLSVTHSMSEAFIS